MKPLKNQKTLKLRKKMPAEHPGCLYEERFANLEKENAQLKARMDSKKEDIHLINKELLPSLTQHYYLIRMSHNPVEHLAILIIPHLVSHVKVKNYFLPPQQSIKNDRQDNLHSWSWSCMKCTIL